MDKKTIIILSAAAFLIIFILILFVVMRSKKKRRFKKMLENLDYQKNEIDTSQVAPELSKVRSYLSNEKLEVMYNGWKERLDDIKEVKIPKITDMLIETEYMLSKKEYKPAMYNIAKLEMEIYKVRTTSDFLLDEIKNVTNSEERNRGSITKQKKKYRKLYQKFEKTRGEFDEYEKIVEKQFGTISKRFEDFEVLMENGELTEVPKIFKIIDDMLNHMDVVIEELPSIILIGKSILPKKIKEISNIYSKMKKEYPLDYLNIEYNIEEANKKIDDILERAKVLNLENSLFDLKVLTEYFENLFTEFEKEKVIKIDYEDATVTFKNKLSKAKKLVKELYDQMDYLKKMYNLTKDDVNNFDEVKKEVIEISSDYKALLTNVSSHSFAYSQLTDSIEKLFIRLNSAEEKLNKSLKKIGNMHDDELRARQQLSEVKELLKKSQLEIKKYNLPVLPNSYYVELKEAKEGVKEIIKELEKKPITIEILNTRVDTARDLSLKLYGKTKEMMKMARFAEMAIVYGNRYRSSVKSLDKSLEYSENLFYKGEYKKSLEITINALNKIEPGIYEKLLSISEERH